ncbi:MAG TPA: oligoendopeptidase F [Anaerolineales bacterium]|nr:oligoendopeptidase F [Anaerolineales bacterium]
MSQSNTLPLRSEVPVEQTWDLESIFPTPEAWEIALKEVGAQLPSLEVFKGRLGEGPQTLADYFETSEKVARLAMKVMVYASLKSAADSSDQAANAQAGQARSLMARLRAATAFDDPEIMAIGFRKLKKWRKAEPRLEIYEHYFDQLKHRQPHVRSAEVEEVLATASDPLGTAMNIYGVLTNADMKFADAEGKKKAPLPVTHSTIGALISDEKRRVRKTAWRSYADGYLAYKNTLTSTLTTAVKRDVFYARSRGYGSSLEASLAPNHIPTEVFHNLIEVFKKNLPTWHRYWRIRKKALGVKKLHVYDIKAPLAQNPPVVPYAQAVEWIADGMAPLGKEYVNVLRKGCLEERWVDWALNQGKRAGAFSSGVYDTHPYIMMSYNDDLYSLSTLAHELGHSLHSYYSRQSQPFMYAGYSLFVAEVASNFNQAMTRAHLFKTFSDADFQISLIEEAMSNYHRYFFIMPTLARFELEVHERAEQGKPISADSLIKLCADLFAEGYGDEVEQDYERIGITWAQFGHLYSNFYVYQYATGISGAQALADGVLSGKRGAAKKYLNFLKAGGSLYPLEALQKAGVDLTSPEPVEAAFAGLAEVVDRLDQIV